MPSNAQREINDDGLVVDTARPDDMFDKRAVDETPKMPSNVQQGLHDNERAVASQVQDGQESASKRQRTDRCPPAGKWVNRLAGKSDWRALVPMVPHC